MQNTIRWGFSLTVGLIAFYAAQPYGAQSPLGVPIPEVPQLIEHEGVEFSNSSVKELRLSDSLLELLTPQPDGLPPLQQRFMSKPTGFSISHPYGTSMTIFLIEDFIKNSLLCQAVLRDDLPVRTVKYSLPEIKADEKVTVYVSRLRNSLEGQDASFLAPQSFLELENYRFESLEYELSDDNGEMRSHLVFFGPFGPRCLVIDFVSVVGQHDSSRMLAEKIIKTFDPGEKVLELLAEQGQDVSVDAAEFRDTQEAERDEEQEK